MNCPTCGTLNDAAQKFCGECGTRLAVTCPTCGTVNDAAQKFCGECGTALSSASGAGSAAAASPSQAAAPPVIAAERRLVSVLFADIVGSTTLAESRDPEAVRELLTRYFETASRIIASYGGTVEKFIGDAVMAVWGTPTAHEDDAERAVRSALDLVEAVHAIGDELGVELLLRGGVVTGEAAVTLGATNQGMVAGDLVNTASRLQAVAPPGTVLVGEATFQSASGAIAFEPAGPQLLKGKAAPVPAHRALRVVARRGGAGRSEQLEAPFVGRDAELRMLKEFHAATGAERRPRLVSIMGQGGIGKSRLVWEFQKYIDGVTEVVYWHQGRSPAYGEGISFWALAEMVRGRAGIAEGEDASGSRAKLADAVAQFVPDPAERAWIEPALLHLLGIESAEGAERERETLFAAWRTFFERIAEQGVVVLVFEDLQWADGGLLDFIDHILDWSRDRPIYLITLARPELLDRRSDWGAGRRNFTSLVLEPLRDDEMRELLSGLVPGLPEGVARAIAERAEGVPLYAVETVRMLLGDGRLERDDGVYRPVGDLSELSVPASLQALIAARLDALDPPDRQLLQAAAVIGKTFSPEALAAVSGSPLDEIAGRLRALVRRELLVVEADPRSPERGQYGFVQSLIREVAYGTLARRDRRRLHLSAARHFETVDDEGIAAALAEHYLAAYRAQPEGPEGEAVAAQARVALRGAAERASALGSYLQAASYLERALEVTTDPDEEVVLRSAAGTAAIRAGRADMGLEHARRALELVRGSGDRLRMLQAITALAYAHDLGGALDQGVGLMEAAARDYADLTSSREYVRLIAELARANLLLGKSETSDRLVGEALPTAERLELTREVLELLITRGAALANIGRLRESIASLVGCVSLGQSYALPEVELRARVNLSYAAAAEDPQLSYRTAREGYELASHLGLRGFETYLHGNACEGAIRLGEWDWVLATTEEIAAEEVDRWRVQQAARRAQVLGLRGEVMDHHLDRVLDLLGGSLEIQAMAAVEDIRSGILLGRGDIAGAYRQALASYTRNRAPDSPALALAGRAAVWLGDVAAARQALEALSELPGRVPAAARCEVEAGLAALDGDATGAASRFWEAIGRWRELGYLFEVALCQLGLVTMLGGRRPEARQAADEARATFLRLGAAGFVELLDRALAEGTPVRRGVAQPATERTPAAS